jgi:glycosyltransferase involved in cell wall biosynthesis
VKVAGVCRVALSLLRNAAAKNATLYIPADAGLGAYYTTLFIILARLFRDRIFIHHHNLSYIDKRVLRMALLARCAESEVVHIFLCPRMERLYRSHYPWARQYMLLSNAWHFDPADSPPARQDSFLVLGHLSNLGPEKGLYDVLDTLRGMLAQRKRVRLVLAGPPTTPDIRKNIEAAMKEFGDALDYRGPVFGADKDKFYRDIDVFLFPTRNEGQPFVVFEAMSQGVPSICYERGCLAGGLAEGGGIVVSPESNFVDVALPILVGWANDSAGLRDARNSSLARAHSHRARASAELQMVLDHIAATQKASRP